LMWPFSTILGRHTGSWKRTVLNTVPAHLP